MKKGKDFRIFTFFILKTLVRFALQTLALFARNLFFHLRNHIYSAFGFIADFTDDFCIER